MNGVVILDKPGDFTSFDAVAVMRGVAKERKIGHTGTLDPMATGVLPLLLGRAAKAADLLPDTEKEYRGEFAFGKKYDTGDCTGRVTEEKPFSVTREVLEERLVSFRGEIFQVPPMYSAISVGGKRLYDLARAGIEVEREARRIFISRLELLEFDEETGTGVLEVGCSKGTYIRTLIEDISAACGTVGTMTALRRTRACGFSVSQAHTLEELRGLGGEGRLSQVLLPVEQLFAPYPAVAVTPAQAQRFCNGGSLDFSRLRLPKILLREGDRLRVYGPENRFLGLGTARPETEELKFCKLFALEVENF